MTEEEKRQALYEYWCAIVAYQARAPQRPVITDMTRLHRIAAAPFN